MAAAVLALVLLLSGCRAVFAPGDAVAFDPPPSYRLWWSSVEACAGRSGDFDRVTWYRLPGRSFQADGRAVIGRWEPPHRIYLAADWTDNDFVVRHEMLHDLLGHAGHPDHPFVTPCGLADPWGAR